MESELLRTDNSFVEIMERYSDMVLRICYVFMRNQADAEDTCQNVFLKLCTSAPAFREEEQIKAWLITVARNECRNYLHSFWRRRVFCTEQIALPSHSQQQWKIVNVVLKLPLKYRDILYLHYYEEYSIKELATLLHMKEPTVKTRLMRGRELLKEALQKGGFVYE